MLEMALKNIWGRKTRSILTIMGIVVAMQLYIILSTIMSSYEKDLNKQIAEMAGKVTVQAKTDGTASFYVFDTVIKESDAEKILSLKEIDSQLSSPMLFQSIEAPAAPNMPPAVLAVGLESGKEKAYFGNTGIKGSNRLTGDHEVILGSAAATWADTNYKAELGGSITIKGEKFKIVGILSTVTAVLDSSVIMPLATAQDIYTRPGVVSELILTAKNADKVEELAKEVESLNPKLAASTSKEMRKSVDDMLGGQRMFFGMINDTIVVVAAFIIMIVMVMAVHERKKEIGTLKALGASKFKILRIIVTESLTLSIIGGLLALPASVLFVRLLFGYWYLETSQWGYVLIVAAILGIVSGLFPAWSAQRVNPLESLRYE
jgi:putative ABC transport system permease protein